MALPAIVATRCEPISLRLRLRVGATRRGWREASRWRCTSHERIRPDGGMTKYVWQWYHSKEDSGLTDAGSGSNCDSSLVRKGGRESNRTRKSMLPVRHIDREHNCYHEFFDACPVTSAKIEILYGGVVLSNFSTLNYFYPKNSLTASHCSPFLSLGACSPKNS